MSIKFSCPNCSKPFTVKDQLGGKRANCPACKKPLTIPKSSSAPAVPPEAHVEDLAAAALMDAPAAPPKPAEEPTTVEFNCPQCDDPVRVAAELQGKQTPCPHCGRIIKVPFRVKNEPKDWRKTDTRMPSGARRAEEPAPEGSWGSATASAVSRQALVGTSGPRRRPLTHRQKLLRGGFLAGCVLIAGVLTWVGFNYRGQHEQKQGYEKAMTLLKAEDSRLPAEARAAMYTQAGLYQLRSASAAATKEGRDHFQHARKLLGSAPNSIDRELLLTDLALAQIELGGERDQAVQGLRVSWDDTAGEVRQTLQQINDPEARARALRLVARKLIDKGQTDKVPTLAQQLGATKNTFNAGAAAPAQDASDAPELLGIAGWELFRAGQTDAAKNLAGEGMKLYKPDGAQPNPRLSGSLVALCVVLEMPPAAPGKGADDVDNLKIGNVQGTAWKDPNQARQLAEQQIDLPDTRWKALVALASAGKDNPDAKALDDAIAIAENRLQSGVQLSPWGLLQMVELAAPAGNSEERLQQLVKLIPHPAVSGRASLVLLQAKLARTDGSADISWGQAVNKNSTSSGLAYFQLARHNAARKALSVKDVDGWEENVKPFGYLGIALGRQDAE